MSAAPSSLSTEAMERRRIIDLRSDTVTRPTPAMREAMAHAPVGDDVWGDDPTVNALQDLAAAMLGKEAALFAPSGTMCNLIALLCHCQRGEEYLVGMDAHSYKYEGGGAAVLGSIQPQPIPMEADGTLDLARVEAAIKPDDLHFAVTRLLSLENTIAGKVLPLDYLERAAALAQRRDLATHLDGARVFNAAVYLGVDVREIARHFDTVSVCLSKGLGAPVGSVLCMPISLLPAAKRWRKMLGGGMRQAGILAAAGIHALENHVERLRDDHANAALLAERLQDLPGLAIGSHRHTNMVFITPANERGPELAAWLGERNILADPGRTIRLVTHLDVSPEDIETTAAAIKEFLSK